MAGPSRSGGGGGTLIAGGSASGSSNQKDIHQYQKLPFPELSRTAATNYVDLLGNIGQRFAGPQEPGTGVDGSPTPGGGNASDFQGYLNNVGGPPANFTDIQVGGVYTPQQVNEGVNAIYAENDARMNNQARDLNQKLGPGIGANSALLAELQQNNQGRYQGLGQDQARKFSQQAAPMNAQQLLASGGAQTNVEAQRAISNQNLRKLALEGRGQDFNRESALLRALLGAAGGGAGLLSPLNFYDDTSYASSFSASQDSES